MVICIYVFFYDNYIRWNLRSYNICLAAWINQNNPKAGCKTVKIDKKEFALQFSQKWLWTKNKLFSAFASIFYTLKLNFQFSQSLWIAASGRRACDDAQFCTMPGDMSNGG